MKHITTEELERRIRVNHDEREATHAAMVGPGCVAIVDPLSEEWACLSARFRALAAQSGELHDELVRRG